MLKKILVVDDSALFHQMYRIVFKRYPDCRLVSAMNGVEALEKLSHEDGIELVLLDISMPVMNGIQVLESIGGEALGKLPVIVISAEGMEEETRRAMALGARACLRKPFQTSELHSLIENILSGNAITTA